MEKRQMGKIILENRKKSHMTQEQLAEKLCLSNKTVSKWERGLSYPDTELLPVLASALNLTIEQLFDEPPKKRRIAEVSFLPAVTVAVFLLGMSFCSVMLFRFYHCLYLLSALFSAVLFLFGAALLPVDFILRRKYSLTAAGTYLFALYLPVSLLILVFIRPSVAAPLLILLYVPFAFLFYLARIKKKRKQKAAWILDFCSALGFLSGSGMLIVSGSLPFVSLLFFSQSCNFASFLLSRFRKQIP